MKESERAIAGIDRTLSVLIVLTSLATSAIGAQAQTCDQTCLIKLTDSYLIGRDKFDLPAAHIFKIGADGKVHEIEPMGFIAPFNAPSGWDK